MLCSCLPCFPFGLFIKRKCKLKLQCLIVSLLHSYHNSTLFPRVFFFFVFFKSFCFPVFAPAAWKPPACFSIPSPQKSRICGVRLGVLRVVLDDATLNSLFWHRPNYHHHVDLLETKGLFWREGIPGVWRVSCLEPEPACRPACQQIFSQARRPRLTKARRPLQSQVCRPLLAQARWVRLFPARRSL